MAWQCCCLVLMVRRCCFCLMHASLNVFARLQRGKFEIAHTQCMTCPCPCLTHRLHLNSPSNRITVVHLLLTYLTTSCNRIGFRGTKWANCCYLSFSSILHYSHLDLDMTDIMVGCHLKDFTFWWINLRSSRIFQGKLYFKNFKAVLKFL